ncbi:pilus assembly protein, partial [Candidatus Venteria ishoeyi]|uniref:hypothetical protein n=1 Tax=Candidatus Venteria ishoeyi TaxID=1899563 RepID=UPI00255CC08E
NHMLDNGSYQKGDAMALFISDDGVQPASVTHRKITPFEHSPGEAATLTIRYGAHYGESAEPIRDVLLDWIANVQPNSYTPLVPAIMESAAYYLGKPVYYGDSRGYSDSNGVSHPNSYTGGAIYRPNTCLVEDNYHTHSTSCSRETICSSLNERSKWSCGTYCTSNSDEGSYKDSSHWYESCSDLEGADTEALYNRPEFSACQPSFIVFLTDGTANHSQTYARDKIKSWAGISECLTSYTISDEMGTKTKSLTSSKEKCGVDIVKYLAETDFDDTLPGIQNVRTHTIGFGVGSSSGIDYMRAWAHAGQGKFYDASNATDLLNAFRQILQAVLKERATFVAPSLSVNAFNKLFNDEEIYFSLFKPSTDASWSGNIKKYKLCLGGEGGCDIGNVLDKQDALITDAEDHILESAIDLWNPNNSDPDG